MRALTIVVLAACLMITASPLPVNAEMARDGIVTMDEALTMAQNWVGLVMHREGNWGGSEEAEVLGIQEFKRGDRLIGYFCPVEPHGFIIVPMRKELGTVKAYSEFSDLNPESEEGLADLIKLKMERVLGRVVELVGPIELISAEDLDRVLEINYRPAWQELGVNEEVFQKRVDSGEMDSDYSGGEPPLLTSHWDQDSPYNDRCPVPGADDDCWEAHCAAGCGAIATAQVLRYWGYPPIHGWPQYEDMPDRADVAGTTQQERDTVAEFVHLVGLSIGQDYCSDGCETSSCIAGCPGDDMLDTFEDDFFFSDNADDDWRYNDSAEEWFDKIKGQLNLNRPIPYHVEGHMIVCDGWKVEGFSRYYHMNYGWGDAHDAWYELDGLHLGDKWEEIMIKRLYPQDALGNSISGWYDKSDYYVARYFDRDCHGSDATFEAGHNLQFLPGIVLTCDGSPIEFRENTRLFSSSHPSRREIKIISGKIRLYVNGGIKFH